MYVHCFVSIDDMRSVEAGRSLLDACHVKRKFHMIFRGENPKMCTCNRSLCSATNVLLCC